MNNINRSFQNRTSFPKHIQGGIMIFFSTLLIVFIGLCAFAIDMGRIIVIRNELQNAADSVALQASNFFYPSGSGGPNWALVQTKAQAVVGENKAAGATLTNVTIQVGYWDLTIGPTGSLKPTSTIPTSKDSPGLRVTVSKSLGNNGGPVSLFFGGIIGIPTVNVSASALAIAGSPNAVGPNLLFPVAMAKGLYDTYWDYTLQEPKIDPATGQPYVFQINEGPNGGWSTFKTAVNDTPSIIDLLTNGNPSTISIGDSIWMSTGVKTAVYDSVPTNKDVIVAVVSTSSPGTFQTVYAFSALHIDFAVGGSSKYIQVRFIKNYKIPATIVGGPYYGVYVPSKLVQ